MLFIKTVFKLAFGAFNMIPCGCGKYKYRYKIPQQQHTHTHTTFQRHVTVSIRPQELNNQLKLNSNKIGTIYN